MKYTEKERKERNKLNKPCYEELARSKDFRLSEIGKRLLKLTKD